MSCIHCAGNHSDPMRGRFFAVVTAAWESWPSSYEYQASNPEELRYWLVTKVGYRTAIPIPHLGLDPEVVGEIVAATIKASERHSFPFVHMGQIYVLTPKSIAKGKSKHKELVGVFQSVEALICTIIGIDSCDQLLKEKENAA